MKGVVQAYVFRAILVRMINKESRYRPSWHPFANDADGKDLRDAEKWDDVGMFKAFPRHDFVPEGLQGPLNTRATTCE
jgi:hypothetical protein